MAPKQRAERNPLEQLHHEIRPSARQRAEIRDPHDARMGDARRHARLAEKSVSYIAIEREVGAQRLEREALPESYVARAVNGPHPALANPRVDLVALVDELSEQRVFARIPARCADERFTVEGTEAPFGGEDLTALSAARPRRRGSRRIHVTLLRLELANDSFHAFGETSILGLQQT